MYLKELSLINFKNYEEAELKFSPKVNCLVGNNGSGKTNVLDAIYYLSFCKSYFNPIDSQNILYDAPFFVIQGAYQDNENEESVYCGLKRNQKKQFKRNKKEYTKLADHIGVIPIVMISPSDSQLILGGSEERRKFIDGVIAQFDRHYLDNLIKYNKALSQRNALLKSFKEKGIYESESLEIWNDQLVNYGQSIFEQRKKFVAELTKIFQDYYNLIADGAEEVSLEYDSKLNESGLKELLRSALDKDLIMTHTTVGIHKDDLVFKIGRSPIKKFGSQGQQKTFLTALKLGQFEFIKKVREKNPILLLDDIFDKLDDIRVAKLMKIVGQESYGQIFITDAHPERIVDIFDQLDVEMKLFHVEKGVVSNRERITEADGV